MGLFFLLFIKNIDNKITFYLVTNNILWYFFQKQKERIGTFFLFFL